MLKTFDEVFDDYTKYGTKIKTEQYHTVGTNIIIDQGQADIAGYTDQIDGLFKDVPVIVFGDHTRIIKYINRPFFLGADGTKILKSKIPDANYKYLYYALKNAKIPNTGYNRHFKWLKQISISYPEHRKQSMIVEILDKLEDSIGNYNTILGLLDKLVKARFIEMFGDPIVNEKGWRTKPLLDMGQCKNGMNFHYDDKGIDINCLGVCDFKNFSVINNTKGLPTVSLNEMPSEEYLLKDDDIVFVRSNGNKALVGRSLVVYPGNVPTTFSGFCIRYRKYDNEIIVPYLLRVLKTDSVRMKMAGRGANIQNLNQQILGTLVIPVPPIELQNQFADFVHQVDKSREAVKKSLEKTQQLYDSLMQEYFG
ncbi:restriction endonuclease subunit S [Holdemanella biformis]